MATWEMFLMVFKEKVFVEEENLQDSKRERSRRTKPGTGRKKPYMDSLLDKLPMKMAQE